MINSRANLRLVTEEDEKAWDQFVYDHPEGTFFHRFIWGRILEMAGKGKQLYFLIEKASTNEIVGIFPFFIVFRPIRNLRCLPLSDYASPLVSYKDNTTEVFSYFLQRIRQETIRNMCFYGSFRLPSYSDLCKVNSETLNLKRKLSSYSIRLHLKDPDLMWRELTKKRRNRIRKAMKSELDIKIGNSLHDFVSYYRLYVKVMKRRATSIERWELFRAIHDNLSIVKDYVMIRVDYKGDMVAAVLAFAFKDGLYLWGNVSDEKYFPLNPNDLAYWSLITYAYEKGYRFVDFGPSDVNKKGNYLFKIQFGGQPFEIYDHYFSPFPFLLTFKDALQEFMNRLKFQ